jgi:large subunit ribosomal protein L35
MPKLKTKKAAAKRFSFTAGGKVKSTQANHAHKMTNKSKGGNRRQKGTTILAESEAYRIEKWLPYGK